MGGASVAGEPSAPGMALPAAPRAVEPIVVPTPRPQAAAIQLPALDLRQPLLPLGLDDEGALEVPSRVEQIGRWRDGPLPGDPGPAVLIGHVDLNGVQGAFAALRALGTGDLVDVRRPDGRTVRFRVNRVVRVAKDDFPTDAVYEPTDGAELRLITCGGRFNRLTGHYEDNVVVFAALQD